MKSYKDIPCWENKKRLNQLRVFRKYVVAYYENSTFHWENNARAEEENAKQARHEIDLMIEEVHEIIRATGVPLSVLTSGMGNYTQNIDILHNLFEIDTYQIKPNRVITLLNRAIGAYQSDRRKSVRRTLNPFWWIGRFLKSFAHMPFRLIGSAGFDRARAEDSILGRLIKTIFLILPIIASLLAILHHLDWLDAVKLMLGMGT